MTPEQKVQYCSQCGEPTSKCKEDALYIDTYGPMCEECFDKVLKEREAVQ